MQEYTLTGKDLTENITLTLTGEGSAAFTITSPANITLTPTDGALSQIVIITFNPTAEQEYEATITHAGAGLTSPVVLTLTGTGVIPTITLQAAAVDITALNFGDLSTACNPYYTRIHPHRNKPHRKHHPRSNRRRRRRLCYYKPLPIQRSCQPIMPFPKQSP